MCLNWNAISVMAVVSLSRFITNETLLFVTGMELNINWTLMLNFHCMQHRLTNQYHSFCILVLVNCRFPIVTNCTASLLLSIITVLSVVAIVSPLRKCFAFSHLSLVDFAFCKHGDRWLCFNDSSVTACQEWNVVVSLKTY